MGFLKNLDFFGGFSYEEQRINPMNALLAFLCSIIVIFMFSRELKEFKAQTLSSKLYVESFHEYSILLDFEIFFPKFSCSILEVSMQYLNESLNLKKVKKGKNGCIISANTYIKPMDNRLIITPNIESTIIDIITTNFQTDDHRGILDLSHKINKFRLGRTTKGQESILKGFDEFLGPNILNGVEYLGGKEKGKGHSMFIYELNLVPIKVNNHFEVIYSYQRNEIPLMTAQPNISFHMNFSPIAVEYYYSEENFFEFLTYLLGTIGGVITIFQLITIIIRKIYGTYEHNKKSKILIEM